jgi:hypothetical protein
MTRRGCRRTARRPAGGARRRRTGSARRPGSPPPACRRLNGGRCRTAPRRCRPALADAELHRPRRARAVPARADPGEAGTAVVGLDLAHPRQDRPRQPRALLAGGLPVQAQVATGNVGAGGAAGLGLGDGVEQAQFGGVDPRQRHHQQQQDAATPQPAAQVGAEQHQHHRRTRASGLTGRPPPGWSWKWRCGGPPRALPVAPRRAITCPARTRCPGWARLRWLWA